MENNMNNTNNANNNANNNVAISNILVEIFGINENWKKRDVALVSMILWGWGWDEEFAGRNIMDELKDLMKKQIVFFDEEQYCQISVRIFLRCAKSLGKNEVFLIQKEGGNWIYMKPPKEWEKYYLENGGKKNSFMKMEEYLKRIE